MFPTVAPSASASGARVGQTGPVPAVLLAHQGGWDELLLVAGPLAVIALLLVLADRRAKRALERTAAELPGDGEHAEGEGGGAGAPGGTPPT